jgi:pimeloyl-ACP methyl ester carboxylesterase
MRMLEPLTRDFDKTDAMRQVLTASFRDPSHVDAALVTRYTDLARAPGHRAIQAQLRAGFLQRLLPSNEVLAGIRVPTLIMQGEQDKLVPVGDARKYAAAIPGAELLTWADEGHLPMQEHPDRSAQALAAFLERVYAPAPAAQPSPTQTH